MTDELTWDMEIRHGNYGLRVQLTDAGWERAQTDNDFLAILFRQIRDAFARV